MESRIGRARRDSDPCVCPRHNRDLHPRVPNNNAKPHIILPRGPHNLDPPHRHLPNLRRPHQPDNHLRRVPRGPRLGRQVSHLYPGSMHRWHPRCPSPKGCGQDLH
ncbi:hypothetical protein LINPERPRIM_LOCUS8957 [Linum perenne]